MPRTVRPQSWPTFLRLQAAGLAAAVVLTVPVFQATAGESSDRIELIGVADLSGDMLDATGETGTLEDGSPVNRLGGFSALDYTGEGNQYLALADRGAGDGAVSYQCRFHEVELAIGSGGSRRVEARLVGTRFLNGPAGTRFIGSLQASPDWTSGGDVRLDPEGLRLTGDGRLLVSEEYGPWLFEFDRDGTFLRGFETPAKLTVRAPSADPKAELEQNAAGRQPNKGFEGVAVAPQSQRIYTILQGPLIQDTRSVEGDKPFGRFARLVEFHADGRPAREFAYPLSDGTGISEILAINETQFLVLERDGKGGDAAAFKQITRFDIANATDISGLDRLPADELPPGTNAGVVETFLDLLDPAYGLAAIGVREKYEGLAFGPRLDDGRLTLVISVDNDFKPEASNQFLVFAIPESELPGFGWDR
ncbi:MAG: esterase-like activity of phytase family protein [Planctomyces sp.]|nr:esterase-like activity of phytase family protein [Planctomyces sp.]